MTNSTNKKRIGCLGLSANPPHLGHLAAARAVLKSGLVDEVWLIPVFAHAFNKPDFAPWRHRVAMTKFLEEPGIIVCEIEGERTVVSYTADTVAALRERHPDYEFFWVIGSDIVARGEYLQWHNWDELKNMIRFIVIDRSGYPICESDVPERFIRLHDSEVRCQSSTLARELIHRHEDVASLVGEQIAYYINQNELYSNTEEARYGKRD
ncbi:MAG: nicotinate (nicotinamide) nucleotide adenylyltransferase [Candidatus Spechtbacteria bacterium]|nr:nicotinate (nicotinamide) nucleotide adenylyltransferase [Candidatus Spechtbacteria bacterium]